MEEDISMSLKQCTCGRSASYPYCDGTHKIKKNINIVEDKTEKESNE